jgi:predicted patatin/cPLA2 family phospholipase
MGACNTANYVTRQPERNRIVNARYLHDPRYLAYLRLLRGGEQFRGRLLMDGGLADSIPIGRAF